MPLEAKMIKLSILNSIRNLYGIYGSGKFEFSILHVNESDRTLVIHTEYSNLVQVQSAITFTTSIQSHQCKIDVLKMSPSLMGLASYP